MTIFVIIIFVLTFIVMGFVFATMFSPKLRGKMLANQIKATKYMMDETKGDIKSISDDMANATKDGITVTAKAIRNGLLEDTKFCKHCGENIDSDSIYCNKCGKKQ